MDKKAVLVAAGLGCGANCACVATLAETMSDEQALLVGHMAEKKAFVAGLALSEAMDPGADTKRRLGGMPAADTAEGLAIFAILSTFEDAMVGRRPGQRHGFPLGGRDPFRERPDRTRG